MRILENIFIWLFMKVVRRGKETLIVRYNGHEIIANSLLNEDSEDYYYGAVKDFYFAVVKEQDGEK